MNYEWQDKFLNAPNDKALLCCETGTGKSHCGRLWIKQKDRMNQPVVFCPKNLAISWDKWLDGKAHIITPQTILKLTILPVSPSAIIIDEAHKWAAPLFVTTKQSKCGTMLYHYIRNNPNVDTILMTATPVRSTPWNLHTLLCLKGHYIPYKDWRDKYFNLEKPYWLPRMTYMEKEGWQEMIQEDIERHALTVSLRDITGGELPPVTEEIVKTRPPKYIPKKDEFGNNWQPAAQFYHDHKLEQHEKVKHIRKIGDGYRKVVCVVRYREQIEDLRSKLVKDRQVFVIDGDTKDTDAVIEKAEKALECYLIIQCSIAAGYELPSFSCMFFISPFGVADYVQMKGRIRRVNDLKPVIYYHFIGGRCDEMIYNGIQKGKSFVPSHYLNVINDSKK